MPTIVITGANGFVGSYMVDYFSAKGWEVRALTFNKSTKKLKGVNFFAYDLRELPPEEAFRGANYVIHTAYSPQTSQQPNAFKINVRAAERLLAVSRKHKIKKNIFISSMSASSDAQSTYGQQKYAIEQLFDTKCDISVRAGLIIGNGGLVGQMVNFIKKTHLVPLIGGGRQPLQIIAIPDLAKAFHAIIKRDLHGRITVANPQVYSYRKLYKAFAQHAGTKTFFVPVPYTILSTGITVSRALRLPFKVTKDNLLGLKQARPVDTNEAMAKLDLQPLDLYTALSNIKDLGRD